MENRKYILRRGMSKDFTKRTLSPGEMAAVIDKHTLAFCFGEGDISYVDFDESVSEETARELIEKIKWFIENSYKISIERFWNGKQG